MTSLRSIPLSVLASALLCGALFSSAALHAQNAAPAVRIVTPIDEGQLVTLKGNTHPMATAQNDRGAVSPDLPMAGLTLVLSRSAAQQAAFDAFVASQYDQGSPNFHHWLTPTQIGATYGPAQADISAISGWLSSHGFAVKSIGADGMTIDFSGTAGQVQSAFHTQIHDLLVNGKPHIANMTDPQIPASLAPVVLGVKGLHNFFPHPLHRVGSKVKFNPDAHGWVRLQNSSASAPAVRPLKAPGSAASATSTSSPTPAFGYTIPNSNEEVEEDVSPYDFAAIYNLPSGWPNSNNGSGQTITIIGTSDIDLSDVSEFKTKFGLPAGKTPVIAHGPDGDPGICSGSTNVCNDGDLDENSLDVQWSGAVAAGAQIVLVTDAYNNQSNPTNDPIYDGAQWAIDNTFVSGSAVYGSHILSVSYGQCELFNGTASNVAYNNLWQTAASAGISVFVATGDSGSPSCDDGGDEIGNPYEAQYGLSVNGLGSSPYNTAVGGTDFGWCKPTVIATGSSAGYIQGCSSSNASTYWNSSNNSTTQASAKGYVPETPWNDTCLNPLNAAFLESAVTYLNTQSAGITTIPATPEETCNFVYEDSLELNSTDGVALMNYVDTVGGSGGASGCVVNSTTTSSTGSCAAGDTSTGSSYGNLTLVNNGWPEPSWQSAAASLGVPTDGVRHLPDVSFFAGDGAFDSATLICVSNDDASCTNLNETGIASGGAEELGGTSVATPQMAGVMALINQNAAGPQGNPASGLYKLAGMQTYSSCSAESGTTSSSCYFNDIDQGTNSMPCAPTDKLVEGGASYDPSTGEWESTPQLYAQASPNCTVVNSGDTIGTLSGYNAATGYDQATGLGSLNIANVVHGWSAASGVSTGSSTATVSISLGGTTSILENQSLTVTVSVSGSGATPTGDVVLSTNENNYESTQTLSAGTATFTIPANTFTSPGTVTLTATYSGDLNYALASNTATVTVSGTTASTGTFSLGAIASPAAVAPGTTANTTATVTASGGYVGTVTLNCTLSQSPTGASNLPSCAVSAPISLTAAATTGPATISVTSTPITSSNQSARLTPANGKSLLGGAVLALLVFFGIPARRKSWRAMLGMVVLALVTLGGMAACGNNAIGTTIPGTTAGTYTFTVTASGNPSPTTSPAAQTFNVTIN